MPVLYVAILAVTMKYSSAALDCESAKWRRVLILASQLRILATASLLLDEQAFALSSAKHVLIGTSPLSRITAADSPWVRPGNR